MKPTLLSTQRLQSRQGLALRLRPGIRGALHLLRRDWPLLVGAVSLSCLIFWPIDSLHALSWRYMLLLLAHAAAVGLTSWRRLNRREAGGNRRAAWKEDAEFGGLLVVAGYLVIQPAGFESDLYPLIYLLVAFLAASFTWQMAVGITAFAILLDVLIYAGKGALAAHTPTLVLHAAFLLIFAWLTRLVLRSEIETARMQKRNELAAITSEQAKDARLTRLRLRDRVGEVGDEAWMKAAVAEVSRAVENALEVIEHALGTHSVAVFLLEEDQLHLRLHEARADVAELRLDAIHCKEGLLGAAMARKAPMRLCGELRNVNWYVRAPRIQSVLLVPLIDRRELDEEGDEGRLQGVIVADRLEAREFTEEDELALIATSREVMRAIDTERVMSAIKLAREETDRVFASIDELNRLKEEREVFDAAIEVVRKLTAPQPINFVALTTTSLDPQSGERLHRIERVWSEGIKAEVEAGEVFPNNPRHVSNAVRDGKLITLDELRFLSPARPFHQDAPLKSLRILRIIPLKSGGPENEVIGTLVCGAKRAEHLGDDITRSLERCAVQVGQSLQRARLFDKNERMATTDGLTGLFNHRTFQSNFQKECERARRSRNRLTLIITDIDHFKSVNDTYGHSTGDLVLREIARLLGGARDTDVVARYGGEEFALLLPDTDAKGGKQIAERIRQAVEAQTFHTELGPLRCTLSLGIATYDPEAGGDPKELFELADLCLYHCKATGRNRSITVEEMMAERAQQAASS